MTSSNLWSIIRSVLLAVASYFVGKNVFGHPLDDVTATGWVSAVVGLATAIWGFFDKTTTLEGFQSALRSVGIAVGGILIGLNKLTADGLNTWLGIIAAIAPIIYSQLSKAKTAGIVAGTIDVQSLKK
jgi:hypothetical protein